MDKTAVRLDLRPNSSTKARSHGEMIESAVNKARAMITEAFTQGEGYVHVEISCTPSNAVVKRSDTYKVEIPGVKRSDL
jgi:hypothetical protein